MDYFDDEKLCSVNEFYDNAKKLKRENAFFKSKKDKKIHHELLTNVEKLL